MLPGVTVVSNRSGVLRSMTTLPFFQELKLVLFLVSIRFAN